MLYYRLYYIITYLCYRLFPLLLKHRMLHGKENTHRASEKLGFYNTPKPSGDLTWFHAASVGELNSIAEIVKILSQDQKILITTGTLNSSKVFEKTGFNSNVIHQFAPLDAPQIVNRFLDHWRPYKGVFIDSELWPNLIQASSKRMPLYMVNARLSDKSFKIWKIFKSLARYMYSKFTAIITASDYDLKKIKNFVSIKKLHCFGNLKCSIPPLAANAEDLENFAAQCEKRIVIVAASTHPNEEEMILDSLSNLFKEHHNLLLILVPRDVSRGIEISRLCHNRKLEAGLRTDGDIIHADTNVYIADTLGELGIWYRVSNIAFVGGSLVDIGGHNIIEAAQLDNALVSGHHFSNFKDIFDLFIQKTAIQIAHNKDELSQVFSSLVHSEAARDNYAQNAENASYCNNIVDNVLNILNQSS